MSSTNYYRLEVRHEGLGKYRLIRGSDRYVVEATARAQVHTWNEQYAKKLAIDEQRRERRDRKQELEDNLRESEERTCEAQAELAALRGILAFSFKNNNRIEWQSLKQNQPFSQIQPQPRQFLPVPVEPKSDEIKYRPQIGIMDRLIPALARKKTQEAEDRFKADFIAWQSRVVLTETTNQSIYEQNLAEFEDWRQRLEAFEKARVAHNEAIDRRFLAYQELQREAVIDYCEMVLSRSEYPECCPPEFELDFRESDKMLVVDYRLPSPEGIPRLSEVKYIRTRGEFVDTTLTKKDFDLLYDDVLSQIALRTIKELYEADLVRAIDLIVFNGSVTTLDPGTGHKITPCILSVRAERTQFQGINLRNVQPRACVDALGGVAGKKLTDLKAVKPLEVIDFSGDRFSTGQTLTEESSSALNEWHELIKTIRDPNDVRFLPIGSLASVLGFTIAEKYSAALSRELANIVASRGLAIEPDARYGGPPYRSSDEIALFRSLSPSVSESYSGASSFLQLCVMIAAADNQITEVELDVARNFIGQSAILSSGEQQRLLVLEHLLCRNPDTAKRSLARLAKRLPVKDRQMIGEVLACVAGADGVVSDEEWDALNRAFKALELPQSALASTLGKLGASFEESLVQEAGPLLPGEPIPSPMNQEPPTQHHFNLDMERVAQISHETTEVIGLLAKVMSEDEPASSVTGGLQPNRLGSEKGEVPLPVVTGSKALLGQPDSPVPLDGLPEKFHMLFGRIIAREQWSRPEFVQLAAEFSLLPLGAIDAINEWADEYRGDFLLEGEDPITVKRELLISENLP